MTTAVAQAGTLHHQPACPGAHFLSHYVLLFLFWQCLSHRLVLSFCARFSIFAEARTGKSLALVPRFSCPMARSDITSQSCFPASPHSVAGSHSQPIRNGSKGKGTCFAQPSFCTNPSTVSLPLESVHTDLSSLWLALEVIGK